VGAELLRADGRADMMKLRNFANTPKKCVQLLPPLVGKRDELYLLLYCTKLSGQLDARSVFTH